ncbi:MAG: 50S ribosomal protein L13 [Candidatus Doudnabacteria bacterium]|nr:50S ribosomal protein L13 [Candidatus Doudnabacteria bacterium]
MKTTKTPLPKAGEVTREWHLLDASSDSFGRIAADAAKFLIGKHRPDYTSHLDVGDFVVIVNAEKLVATGTKMTDKQYYRHSKHPGGIRSRTLEEELDRDATEVFRTAVKGMLPKNRLQKGRLDRLKIYTGSEHPHAGQLS